jgi:hypothetical protein
MEQAHTALLQSLKDEVPQAVLVGNTLRLDELHKTLNLPQADFSKILNDWREEGTGNTLLHKAALGLDLNMVNKLLEYGIDHTVRNTDYPNRTAKIVLYHAKVPTESEPKKENIINVIGTHEIIREQAKKSAILRGGTTLRSMDTNDLNTSSLKTKVSRPQSASMKAGNLFLKSTKSPKVKKNYAAKVSDKNHNASILEKR